MKEQQIEKAADLLTFFKIVLQLSIIFGAFVRNSLKLIHIIQLDSSSPEDPKSLCFDVCVVG